MARNSAIGMKRPTADDLFNTQAERDGITDPEYSMACGIQELRACLESAGVESPIDMEHIKLVLQGYNFGKGYISWAKGNYGGYSVLNAAEFSERMAEQVGWSGLVQGDGFRIEVMFRWLEICVYLPQDSGD